MATPNSAQNKQNPIQQKRIEQIRENFAKKKRITQKLSKIGRKIGIYSGKGGVGKSTIACYLAVYLANLGKSVAIFDCDIDCPNVHRILGISKTPEVDHDKLLIPSSRFGVGVMTMGFMQKNEDEAIIWRGPMIHNAINQFLEITKWGELDYLIIDLPPGTSDAPLTVMQTINPDGFVIVSTPQELALIDARRSLNMVKKLNIKIYGIIENMAGEPFGQGGTELLAEDTREKFLGRINMHPELVNTPMKSNNFNLQIERELQIITTALLQQL